MKCLNLIRRHGKTLLPLLAFLALPIFSLGFSSGSVSAIEPVYSNTVTGNIQYACTGVPECRDLSYFTISCEGDIPVYSYVGLSFTGNDVRFYYNFSDYYSIPVSYSWIQVVAFPSGASSCTFDFYNENPLFSSPTGSLSITANGTYDVLSYAEAVVEVPDTETIIQGDYHDDLVDIKNIALVAIAVALFICFGRLILGMFMGLRR